MINTETGKFMSKLINESSYLSGTGETNTFDTAEAVAESDELMREMFFSIVKETAGEEGVIHGKQMKTFVNLGTMGTEAVAEMEETLAANGIPMLDSPITGGVQRAWDADITVITSGPQAVYDQVGRRTD